MKIFNTETKIKEEFKPIKDSEVNIYVCGPTVYDFIHIGNARPMIVFDTLRRYLLYKGFLVKYVTNFTDIDDKIIKKSLEEKINVSELVNKYIYECKKDMNLLNIMPATVYPLVTNEIDEIINMILILVNKGLAYEKNGTVYFRTRNFKSYGKLSHKKFNYLKSGFREVKILGKDDKENPFDFVLWKPKKMGEPYWSSPWSDGRPGWHIECSAMIKKYFGDTIDIHAGGEDLIFPHHENEIAQSEGVYCKKFVNYWMHNAFLNIDNKKMSKSVGNFFTVRDISTRYDPMLLRFFILTVHYRTPLNFNIDLMMNIKPGFERIINTVNNLNYYINNYSINKLRNIKRENIKSIDKYRVLFEESMDDDLNTANAISVIFEFVRFINSNVDKNSSIEFLKESKKLLITLCDILGLKIENKKEILVNEIKVLISKREQARKKKDFALADKIRNNLLVNYGIILEDTSEGVKWKRV